MKAATRVSPFVAEWLLISLLAGGAAMLVPDIALLAGAGSLPGMLFPGVLTGMALVWFGLRRTGWYRTYQRRSADARLVAQLALFVLMAALLSAGVAFTIALDSHRASLEAALLDRVHLKSDLLETNLELASRSVDRLAESEAAMHVLRAGATSTAAADLAQPEVSSLRIGDADGHTVYRLGEASKAKGVRIRLADSREAELLWQAGLVMRVSRPVIAGDRVAGWLEAEILLPGYLNEMLLAGISSTRGSSAHDIVATQEVVLCARDAGGLLCFPRRLLKDMFRPAHAAVPMVRALGGDAGMLRVRDDRGVEVAAAFAPVGRSGLGMVVKRDVAELRDVLHEKIYWMGAVVTLIVLAGGVLTRIWVRPMVNELVDRREALSQIIVNAPDAVVTIDALGIVTSFSPAAERIFGWNASEIIGRNVNLLMPEPYRSSHDGYLANHHAGKPGGIVGIGPREILAARKDGSTFPAELAVGRIGSTAGQVHFVGLIRDLSLRKQAENRLFQAEARFQAVYEQSVMPIVMVDLSGRVLDANQAFRVLVGYGGESIRGFYLSDLMHPDDRIDNWLDQDRAREPAPAGSNPTTYCCTRRYLRRDGGVVVAHHTVSLMLDAEGRPDCIALMVKDVTEDVRHQERLAWLAHHDNLTGLPNRYLLHDHVEQALARSARNGHLGALIFIDLDRFKVVNDTLGHAAGDRLLREASRRMGEVIRVGDTLARLGGDEFVLLAEDIEGADAAALIAEKVLQALRTPFLLDGEEFFISASLGVAVFPGDGDVADIVLRNADAAMFRAKEAGRDGVLFYSPEMNARTRERAALESALHRALEREEFELFYQPKVDLTDGRISGMEALLRWRHPERGLVSPAEFIPMLEETGLIVPVGDWVIRTACAQVVAWLNAGLEPLRVAINISARQFQESDLAGRLAASLAEHGLYGGMIELELTESLLMREPDRAQAVMEAMRQLGCRLSVDDFGTGYSSLAYLKRFPIDTLKIDRSFIMDLPDNLEDTAIAQAILGMADALQLSVVAEGVETIEQARFLKALGCSEMQGYLYSRPLPAAEMAALLVSGRLLDLG